MVPVFRVLMATLVVPFHVPAGMLKTGRVCQQKITRGGTDKFVLLEEMFSRERHQQTQEATVGGANVPVWTQSVS